jgi:hypothetical protein
MEAICSSETSVETQRTTRRHIPEDDTLQIYSPLLKKKICLMKIEKPLIESKDLFWKVNIIAAYEQMNISKRYIHTMNGDFKTFINNSFSKGLYFV